MTRFEPAETEQSHLYADERAQAKRIAAVLAVFSLGVGIAVGMLLS